MNRIRSTDESYQQGASGADQGASGADQGEPHQKRNNTKRR